VQRYEISVLLFLGVLALTAGLTWLFGPYGLAGAGAVLMLAALLVPTEKGE
jgi:hypothetical protein